VEEAAGVSLVEAGTRGAEDPAAAAVVVPGAVTAALESPVAEDDPGGSPSVGSVATRAAGLSAVGATGEDDDSDVEVSLDPVGWRSEFPVASGMPRVEGGAVVGGTSEALGADGESEPCEGSDRRVSIEACCVVSVAGEGPSGEPAGVRPGPVELGVLGPLAPGAGEPGEPGAARPEAAGAAGPGPAGAAGPGPAGPPAAPREPEVSKAAESAEPGEPGEPEAATAAASAEPKEPGAPAAAGPRESTAAGPPREPAPAGPRESTGAGPSEPAPPGPRGPAGLGEPGAAGTGVAMSPGVPGVPPAPPSATRAVTLTRAGLPI
jgi:hypothetical protein